MIRVFAIGDVIGRAGRGVLTETLGRIRSEFKPDIVMLNGENLAGGFGLTEKIYDELINEHKIDCITMGNHWHDKKEIFDFVDKAERLVVPANMGNVRDETMGLKVLKSHSGKDFAAINLIGKAFMFESNRNPFEAAARLLEKIPRHVAIRIVDMHAEATSEKQGMGFFLKGRVSLVYGTHSHVPTADERILAEGTGFITDIGATGAYDSIIGMDKDMALKRMLTGIKARLEPAENDPWLCAIAADFDDASGHCQRIQRVQWRLKDLV